MATLLKRMLIASSLLSASFAANASLITNGSFEQLLFDDSSKAQGQIFNTNLADFTQRNRAWDVFYNLPGWQTSYGNGIELQKNVVTNSQDGQYHVELDSHTRGASNSAMTQIIDSLVIGQNYQLEFYYKPRTNRDNDNAIHVYWHDADVNFDQSLQAKHIADGSRSAIPNWQLQTVQFKATATEMALSFASVGAQNTLGGLIDNVSLVAVSEPPVIALMLGGAALFGFRRRQANK
ncbi:PEP-CTERM sorting domain-containing protein [Thalassotalea montiporae]